MAFATFDSTTWPQGIIQLLDDHHLVVLSDNPRARHQFSHTLSQHLSAISDTQVVSIDGKDATNLSSFCRQIEHRLAAGEAGSIGGANEVNTWWRDIHSVIEALRRNSSGPKRRYFIWNDADVMLEADVDLFCRLVNALLGVAAECEHVSLDPVMLQRVVFLGGNKLGAYAEDQSGQFCRWLEDEEDSPFWEVASVVTRPPVLTYRIDG